jgi:membrane-associated phospholipid phosphatase
MFLGGEVMMVGNYVFAQALGKPSRTLYYLLMCLVNVWFTIFVKLVLHRPRPYMIEEAIQVYGSSSEFGDPSGHTMSCAQVLTTCFLDYLAETGGLKSERLSKTSKVALFSVFHGATISVVGYSRMYNGVHSLDQVIVGGLLGYWQALFGHYLVREPLYRHVDMLA